MRLTFVITNAPPLVGGLEKVCLRLAQQLKKEGHTVRILGRFTEERHKLAGYFRDTQKPGILDCEGIKVEMLTLDARARLLLSPVFKLIWRPSTFPLARKLYVAALGPQLRKACAGSDVVHYFGVGREMLGFAAEAATRKVGARFIVEPALHEGQWGDKWLDALLYKRADMLFAHSHHEKGVLQRMGIPSVRICTLAHGVDACNSGNGDRFRLRHEIAGPMVLFLGRKTMEKGVGRLLEAWPEVAARFPEATLVFAGPRKGKEEELEKLAVSSWQLAETREQTSEVRDQRPEASAGKILDLDDLTEGEKQDALAACDVLCVPSEGESFGIVYFEAWNYGKPVVALDLPVLRETVGASRAGILATKDPREIAQGVVTLLENAEMRTQMGESGRKVALGHTWEKAAVQCLQGYEQAIKNKTL
jgi:glycosyltransferase involved in cell wall biosynthesis